MKKISKRVLVVLVVMMSFVIGVSAGGNWKGSQVVDNIRNEQVQTIRDLFTTKNNKITELENASSGDAKRIGKLELQIHALNETVVLKDQEILIKVQEIQALENELAEAYNDVVAIQTDLGQIITEQEE